MDIIKIIENLKKGVMKMFKKKAIKGFIYLLAIIMLTSSSWVMAKKPIEEQGGNKETKPKVEAKEIQGGVQMEEYVPKVIIEAKWQKTKEKLVPHEWDPWGGWISCGREIYGRFGEGTASFGFSHSNITGLLPPRMPRSIAIDKDKNLYILDPVNLRVLKFNKDGMYLETINLDKRFEKQDFWFLEGKEKIYVDKENNIYIKNVETVYADIKKTLFFSKTGKFIGTRTYTSKESKEEERFIVKIEDSKRGIVQAIDQKKDIERKITVDLSPKLIQKGYILGNMEVFGEDKWGNLYIRIIAKKPLKKVKILGKMDYIYEYIGQICKYDFKSKILSFGEREIYDYDYFYQPPTIVVTDDGTVYELVITGIKKLEKKDCTYKLDPSDKMLKELEGIDEFLKERQELIKKIEEDSKEEPMFLKTLEEEYGKEGYPRKGGKITLHFREGGYHICEKLQVIKWEKKKE